MQFMTPRDLLDLALSGMKPSGPVAFDTETSGLHPDDGARVAVLQVAWEDQDGSWLDFANDNKSLHWAIETYADGQQAAIVSAAWPFDQGVAGTGKPEDHGQGTLFEDAPNLDSHQWRAAMEWLELVGGGDAGDPALIAHNAKFDLTMMKAGVRRWPGLGVDLRHRILWDTQVVNDLIYPMNKTSLKPTAARLFGEEYEDESKKVHAYLKRHKLPAGRWDLMPWDIIGAYADLDPRLTLMLYLRQRHDIDVKKAGKWLHGKRPYDSVDVVDGSLAVYEFIERRHAIMRLLTTMEWRGLPYAEVESRETAIECRDRAAPLIDALPFRPTLDAAKHFYFGEGKTDKGIDCLNLTPYEVTEKGSPQMTAEIVTRMLGDDMPHIQTWAEYQKVTTAASMWYEGYADKMGPDGRLRTVFRQNGTVSGRFSVERVNLQAIPQDYRLSAHSILEGLPTPRQLIALAVTRGLPGWKLWELDLAQAELRVAAMFAKCKTMLQMIDDGSDLHTFTTKELFEIGPDHAEFGKYRQVGKRGNFSLIFGSGGDTFGKMVAKETGIRFQPWQSSKIVKDWNALYPEFEHAIDLHMNRVIKRQHQYGRGWIDLLNGERRWFAAHEDAHKAFNQRVQPNLAQFGIDWMLATERLIQRDGYVDAHAAKTGIGGAGLLLTIHDSQALLLPDNEHGDQLAAAAADAGRHIWKNTFDVPGDVDRKVWSK